MLLILRWICFYPGQQAQVRISLSPIRNHESQPTTQLPVKKVMFAPENYFLLKFMWFEWIDLTINLRILLSVKDFANHAKFAFSWLAWAVYGTNDQNHMAGNLFSITGHMYRWRVAKIINFILNFSLAKIYREKCEEREILVLTFYVSLCHGVFGLMRCWFPSWVTTILGPQAAIGPQAAGTHPCHMAISHCCQARNQGGERRRTPSQIWLQMLNQWGEIVITA